jgi:hypothetical protein
MSNPIQLEADYLIIGAGAVGMAFADTLIAETDATVVIVDSMAKPGGHWNIAYPFVTLHQPSAYYGVNSVELSKGRKDPAGWNQGLGELASGTEVLAYFEDVMRHRLLPSGRVQYFPLCDAQGDDGFVKRLTGQRYTLNVRRKTVDATWLKTTVPANHKPGYTVGEGVRFIPVNGLPTLTEQPEGYVVVGGGKTGIDACLWLLAQGVEPDHIRWIMPRDAWLLDRRNTQATDEFFGSTVGGIAAQYEAAAAATSIEDLFDRLEAAGVLLRIDPSVRPRMFHGATVSLMELEQLRRIRNIIRMGRVQRIERDRIVFAQGELPTSPDHVYVDCSASAIGNMSMRPIFEGKRITPQTVRAYQPVFSAAFIAHVEAAYEDDPQKNRLCGVVPLPNHDTDWIRMMLAMNLNQYHWSKDPGIGRWLVESRLDAVTKMLKGIQSHETEKQAIVSRLQRAAPAAMTNLQRLAAEIA